MAVPQLADLVLETSNAPGTGPIVLGGAPEGRQTFADAFPAGGEVYYYASDGQQTEWGVGTLTVGSPNMLARTTVLGNLFGTKTALNFTQNITVWCEIPAEKCLQKNSDGSFSVRAETDYTQDEAVSAKSADARFAKIADPLIHSRVGGPDWQVIDVGVNKVSGKPWAFYLDEEGNGHYQFTALVSDLDEKANLSGGNTFSGNQEFNDTVTLSDGKVLQTIGGVGGVTVNRYTDSSGIATTDLNNAATGANISWFRLYQDGMLRTNIGDVVFNHRDIDYGPINGGYYSRVGNVLTQSFTISANHNMTINLPIAMSNNKYAIGLTTVKDSVGSSSSHILGYLKGSKANGSFVFMKSWVSGSGAGDESEMQDVDVIIKGVL